MSSLNTTTLQELTDGQEPLVSFVVVSYKTPHLYRNLLQGIQDAKFSFPYEFYFVDNDSQDGTVEMVRERFPWAKVIESGRNRGLGAALNLALPHLRGKYVSYLNPDLIIFQGEIDRWVQWMESNPSVGMSGPRIVNPDGTDQASCYRFPGLFTPLFRRTFLGRLPLIKPAMDRYIMKEMDRTKEQDVDWLLGAAYLIHRDLLDRIGRFDERFFMYFEDTDVCRRVWKAGARVTYTPIARIVHYHQRQSRTRHWWGLFGNKVARIHLASGVKYFLKYVGQPNPRP